MQTLEQKVAAVTTDLIASAAANGLRVVYGMSFFPTQGEREATVLLGLAEV